MRHHVALRDTRVPARSCAFLRVPARSYALLCGTAQQPRRSEGRHEAAPLCMNNAAFFRQKRRWPIGAPRARPKEAIAVASRQKAPIEAARGRLVIQLSLNAGTDSPEGASQSICGPQTGSSPAQPPIRGATRSRLICRTAGHVIYFETSALGRGVPMRQAIQKEGR